MAELLNNPQVVGGAMAVISFLVTQALKWILIKPYTNKLNKRAKTLINSIILIIAFGSAVLCEYLYSHFWLESTINFERAFNGWGGASIVYSVFEVFVKLIKGDDAKIENPYKTVEGTDTVNFVKDVISDGKIDKKDTTTAKEFYDKLNQVK